MFFNISEDMKIVRELHNMTQDELADELNDEPLTIKRIENGITNTSKRTLDLFYDFVYKKKIYLNKINHYSSYTISSFSGTSILSISSSVVGSPS